MTTKAYDAPIIDAVSSALFCLYMANAGSAGLSCAGSLARWLFKVLRQGRHSCFPAVASSSSEMAVNSYVSVCIVQGAKV